ncbi:MAG TPA: NifU family protein [Chthoniobacteraceae bacterium]|jgi:Fe-S cluster biogenesis protein NfuA/nitrite reductase/ring-hydroxylating ferredoxin subunit|nr:NifU family protein [Chthoniobacteraceae bacterium]
MIDEMNQHGRRIEELVAKIDELQNAPARALVSECLESLLAFYGQGLERILTTIQRAGIGGQKVYDDLIHDNVISGMLLIHGLHPIDLGTRLGDALEKIRPYMQSHGGNVELISLENEFARLRLQGACKTCPSSSVTLELAVRHAIEEACPDLAGFEVEGAAPAPETKSPRNAPEWTPILDAERLAEGAMIRTEALGAPLLLCRTDGNLYAYRDRCPTCNLPLHLGTLEAGVLACRAGHRFSVRDAGAGLGGVRAHLEPVPLVFEAGRVQVAVESSPADECLTH